MTGRMYVANVAIFGEIFKRKHPGGTFDDEDDGSCVRAKDQHSLLAVDDRLAREQSDSQKGRRVNNVTVV
jgi:hypothetical protein